MKQTMSTNHHLIKLCEQLDNTHKHKDINIVTFHLSSLTCHPQTHNLKYREHNPANGFT